MEKGGVGLGSLTVSADAVTAGETLDVLTLKSGYVRTSGMYNDNAKPARLLFAGGASYRVFTLSPYDEELRVTGVWDGVSMEK